MKKTMVCVLALAVLCTALLAGCGAAMGNGTDTTGTNDGVIGDVAETLVPNTNDGVVNDTDGILDGNDAGRTNNDLTGGTATGTAARSATTTNARTNGTTVRSTTTTNARTNGTTVGTAVR